MRNTLSRNRFNFIIAITLILAGVHLIQTKTQEAHAALQSLNGNGYFEFPEGFSHSASASFNFTSLGTLTSTTSKYAMVFEASQSCTVTQVGFRTVTVTTAADVDVRLETINNATGTPTGILVGTNSNGTVNASTTSIWTTAILSNPTPLTQGTTYAVVIQASSSVANISLVIAGGDNTGALNSNFPYSHLFASSTWGGRQIASPIMALRCNDGTYMPLPGVHPFSNVGTLSYQSSNSSQDRIGVKFQFPFPTTIAGINWYGVMGASSTVYLYGADGSTVLASRDVYPFNAVNNTATGNHFYMFPTRVNLAANTWYRVVVAASSTNANITSQFFTVSSTALMGAESGGSNYIWTTATSSLDWKDNGFYRPRIALYLTAFDDGASNGRVIIRRAKVSYLDQFFELAQSVVDLGRLSLQVTREYIAGMFMRSLAMLR